MSVAKKNNNGKEYHSILKKREVKRSLSDRDLDALDTEKAILEYLGQQEGPISFYSLYKGLGYSSGKAQSAINRMQKDKFIHVRKKIDKFKTFVWHKPFQLDPDPLELEDEDTIIFPVRLNRVVGAVFQQIPELSDEYGNFMEIVAAALVSFFQEKIDADLKEQAIMQAVSKGILTKELGEQILGRSLSNV